MNSMKIKNIYISCFLMLFVALIGYGQNDTIQGYRIDGDEVVFTFDTKDYDFVTYLKGYKKDFQDLNIDEVLVSGEFNNWSTKSWRMKKIDENKYELRKKLKDFDDKFTWEFKFVINNMYWAEPSKHEINSVPAKQNGHDLRAYNLRMFTAYPGKDGNLTFTLDGFEDANKVVLSGTFNLWDEKAFQMFKTETGWELSLNIKPGEYEYKFIVDGIWIEDPCNLDKRKNEYKGYNSIINIKAKETFLLKGNLNAQKVILSGSFNSWSEDKYIMTKVDIGWEFTVELSGGKHHYKFIVDDKWIIDPDNSVKEYDYDGHVNSVRMVK